MKYYTDYGYEGLGLKEYKGTIETTGEKCVMVQTGYWEGSKGRHITSYIRKDIPDNRQYSKDRHNRFWIETED